MLMTQAEWARRRGFSRQYVGQLVQRGVVRLTAGKVDPAQAEAALAAVREPARPPRRVRAPRAERSGENDRPRDSRGSEPLALLPAHGPGQAPGGDPGSGPGQDLPTLLLKTRIKSEVERARLLEIKAKVESGKYVDADDVKVAAFNRARIVRDALLSIPDRLAAVLAAETETQKVHAIIASEVRQALEELTDLSAEGRGAKADAPERR